MEQAQEWTKNQAAADGLEEGLLVPEMLRAPRRGLTTEALSPSEGVAVRRPLEEHQGEEHL